MKSALCPARRFSRGDRVRITIQAENWTRWVPWSGEGEVLHYDTDKAIFVRADKAHPDADGDLFMYCADYELELV